MSTVVSWAEGTFCSGRAVCFPGYGPGAVLPGDAAGLEGDLLLHRLVLYRLVFGLFFNF